MKVCLDENKPACCTECGRQSNPTVGLQMCERCRGYFCENRRGCEMPHREGACPQAPPRRKRKGVTHKPAFA